MMGWTSMDSCGVGKLMGIARKWDYGQELGYTFESPLGSVLGMRSPAER